jgi:hypothetical protein
MVDRWEHWGITAEPWLTRVRRPLPLVFGLKARRLDSMEVIFGFDFTGT